MKTGIIEKATRRPTGISAKPLTWEETLFPRTFGNGADHDTFDMSAHYRSNAHSCLTRSSSRTARNLGNRGIDRFAFPWPRLISENTVTRNYGCHTRSR